MSFDIDIYDIFQGDGTPLKNKSKISWNDIINPKYNTGKISPWNSNETTQKQHSYNSAKPNSAASSGNVAQQLRKKTTKPQNNQKSQPKQDSRISSKWAKKTNDIHAQQEQPPKDGVLHPNLKTAYPLSFDAYYSDYTTIKPTQEYQYAEHDLYYYFYPEFYGATVNPTPFYDYPTKKKRSFLSSTEEPEYEGEEMTTVSGATRRSAAGNEIEAEDITTDITTSKPKTLAVNIKVTTTTERTVTEEVELEDRTTIPSIGQSKQKTTTQPQEVEAEDVTTSAPRKPTLVKMVTSKGGAKVRLNRPVKRYPPKYRFPKNQQRHQVPVLKEVNSVSKVMTRIPTKTRPIYSSEQKQIDANKIKNKIVHKSTRIKPVVKSSVVHRLVPKQYSYIQELSNRKISIDHKTVRRHNMHLQNPVNVGQNERQGCSKRQKCPSNLRPVCGTDGMSYRNKCVLKTVACV
ncbi:uncharacterized protein LOC133204934 [Saccostrea echinata]|uniref:uncharacterized protein LOC133204934 n=1 Tax=Saccostrea echinata TaxID=191078 RepID=UPI002A83D6E2|nr:uncharacterized protein LOC133204934 [Saccostrea echinata]